MNIIARRGRIGLLARILCIAVASASLAGCVVVPARPYHPWVRVYP